MASTLVALALGVDSLGACVFEFLVCAFLSTTSYGSIQYRLQTHELFVQPYTEGASDSICGMYCIIGFCMH